MIESVSTGWVYGASLNPLNERSDCAQVKTSESAERLAGHEEPQKHGILMRLFIRVAQFFGFTFQSGVGAERRANKAPDSSVNNDGNPQYSAQALNEAFDCMYHITCGKVAKAKLQLESLPLTAFMSNYSNILDGDKLVRNLTGIPSDLTKLAALRPELASLATVAANINNIEIVDGFKFTNCNIEANKSRMEQDPLAAAKVYGAMQYLVEQFAGLPNPSETDARTVVSFAEQVEANFKTYVAAQRTEEKSPVAQSNDQPDPVALIKNLKLDFVKIDDEVSLPTRNDFYATIIAWQKPMSPLSLSFEHLERLAEDGSGVEKSIASMVLDHKAVGQICSYGDIFGQRKAEPALLQAHSALSFMETLQKKLDTAGRLLGNLQAADAA